MQKLDLVELLYQTGGEFNELFESRNLTIVTKIPSEQIFICLLYTSQVLSKLSVMLMDEQFTNSLINAGSVDEFLNIIDSAEKAKDEKEAAKEAKAKEPVEVKKDDVFIVAVTACPCLLYTSSCV